MRIFTMLAAIVFVCAPYCPSSRAEDAAPAPAASTETPASQLAATGKAFYAQHCSHCHGPNMVTPGTVAYDLRRFPHDQKDRFVESVIYGKNGRMPAWGDAVSLEDIDALWAYLLTGGKS
jgi:mono/diheme cytochrome c family protein